MSRCSRALPAEGRPSKDEIRASAKADSSAGARLCREQGLPVDCDICGVFEYYSDGECDTFCGTPDPDCASPSLFAATVEQVICGEIDPYEVGDACVVYASTYEGVRYGFVTDLGWEHSPDGPEALNGVVFTTSLLPSQGTAAESVLPPKRNRGRLPQGYDTCSRSPLPRRIGERAPALPTCVVHRRHGPLRPVDREGRHGPAA